MAPSSCTSVMSVVYALLFLFPVLLAAAEEPAYSASAQMVMAACKTVGGGSRYVGVLFCEEALGSVYHGSDLDYQVFAGLAVGLLADNATSTQAKIDRLLRRGSGGVKLNAKDDAAVARCLLSCRSLYGGIVDGEPACAAAVKAGKFGEAAAILEKAAAAAKECEDGFGKNKAASTLSAENGDAFELAKLGAALAENA